MAKCLDSRQAFGGKIRPSSVEVWRQQDGAQRSGERRPGEPLQPRVEAAAGAELSAQGGVLKQQRRQQSRRDRQEVGAQILDLPFQLHSPVLEPGFHLENAQGVISSRSFVHSYELQWFLLSLKAHSGNPPNYRPL